MISRILGAAAQPDLNVYGAPALLGSLVVKGATIAFNYSVGNFGTGVAGASVSGVFLSTDSTITTSDLLLTTDSVEALSTNFGHAKTVYVNIPATLATGSYYIGVIADYGNAVAESNEANNTAVSAAFAVTAAGQPDLDVYYTPTLSSSAVAKGGTTTLTFNVDNLGNAAAGASTAGVYLSTDSTITTSDTLLATSGVQALSPNFWDSKIVSVTIPTTLAAGTYYIGAIADYNNAIAESNETNNPSVGVALTVAAPGQPDLDVNATPTLSSGSAAPGAAVTFNYKVDNFGSAAAGASTSGIYLSTDGTITTSDTLLTTDAVASIAAGSSSSKSVSVGIPDTLAAGTYYIGAITDYNNAVAESNETNNPSSGVALTVTAPRLPDLDVVYSPAFNNWVVKGGTFTLTYNAYNYAPGAAGASISAIYLSTDSNITTSDTLLTTDSVGALGSYSVAWRSVSVTLPDSIAVGKYYLGVIPDYNNAIAESDETNNASPGAYMVIAARQADLSVQSGTPTLSSSSVVAGGSVTLTYKIDNLGTDTAVPSKSGIYLSTDHIVGTSATLLTTDALAAVAAGTSSSRSVSVTIPSTLAAGTYYVGAVADYNNAIAESNEGNNSYFGAVLTVTTPGVPDLVVKFTPYLDGGNAVAQGRSVTFHYEVDNFGVGAASSSTSGIYLSTDSIITTADTLLTTESVNAIVGKGYTNRSVSVTIPVTIATGSYYIGAIADYNNAIAESNETNNTSIGVPVSIAKPVPDLIMDMHSSPTLSSTWVTRGGKLTFTYEVDNVGTATVGSSTSGIYLSTDGMFTSSDTLLATDTVAAIAPDGRVYRSVDITIPDSITAGNYYIAAIADYNNAIAESNETNNRASFLGVAVTTSNPPDLRVHSTPISSIGSVVKGGNFTLNYEVDNQGGAAGSSVTGIYLSTDSTITMTDTRLTTDAVAAIASGAVSSESVSVTIPGTLAAGTYYIGAIANYDSGIFEINASNNSSVGVAVAVTTPILPDLDVVRTLTLSSSSIVAGGRITLDYIVDNLGTAAAGPSTAGIYLSTSGTVRTSDTLLATDAVPAIAAGSSSSESISVTIPGSLRLGTSYYIGVIADYNNAVAETDETNNPSVGRAITVTPSSLRDLYLAYTPTLSSSSVVQGGSFSFTYGVDAGGSGIADATVTGIYLSTDRTITTSDELLAVDALHPNPGLITGSVRVTIPYTVAPGTYYVGVVVDYTNVIAESDETDNASPGIAITVNAAAQDDYSGSTSTRGTLVIGASTTGSIEVAEDNDYFRVQLVAGTPYEFDLKGLSSGAGTLRDPVLELHGSDNSSLAWNDNGGRAYLGASTDAQIVCIPQVSGTYYLHAQGGDNSTGTYQLTSKTLSPDYYIQGILDQPNVRWNAGAPLGTAVNITYSFPTTLPSEYSPSEVPSYKPFSEAQKAAVRLALANISTYATITFTEVSESDGQIRFGTSYQGGLLAGATIPYSSGDALTRADVALANEVSANASPSVGTTGYETLLHEIEHALGLKHPGNYNAGGVLPTPPYLPTSQDGSAYTVETYNTVLAHDKTPMLFDVAALQYTYGANLATQKGNDTYNISAGSLFTIWDTAGNDTLSVNNVAGHFTLDLRPGVVSYGGYDGGDPVVAIAFNTTIENAIGGNVDDKLLGNTVSNMLTGGGGNDLIDGGAGVDTAVYAGKRANFTVTNTGVSTLGITVMDKTGAEGTDNLFNIERLQFADGNVALDVNGTAGGAYRIYQAAFDRAPDKAGLGYWIAQMDKGMSVADVAASFIASAEFKALYGANPSDDQFLTKVYGNVLGRAPDAAGFNWWLDQLANDPAMTQARCLANFSESAENQANLIGVIGNGFDYTFWNG